MESRLRILIFGKVQGVFFRANTLSEAQRLGLSGSVKNLADGSVEVVAEGDPKKLMALRDWCRKGPAGASVEGIDEKWGVATGEFRGFSVSR